MWNTFGNQRRFEGREERKVEMILVGLGRYEMKLISTFLAA